MFEDLSTFALALVMFALIMAPLVYFFRAVLRFSHSLELVDEDSEADGVPLRAPAVDYAMSTILAMPFGETLNQAKLALQEEGFGVVSEIDVAGTLNESGRQLRPYTILAAWDADTMAQVLKTERPAGLLMPARVVVYEVDGGTAVVAMDPRVLLKVADNANLLPLAVEARSQLQRVIDRLDVGTVTLVN